MGLGVSKCCKERPSDDAARAERTPLNDAERGSAGAGTSGRATSDRQDPSTAPLRAGTPVDPDPDVFYAKPQSRSSPSFVGGRKSRRDRRFRGGPSDTSRETSGGAPDKTRRATKHHQRSNARVGEARILKFHKEHPDEAPLLGSSSEEEFDADGQPIPKNWIGVCPAKLQHRVWWWSITFVLCFIAGMGVFLGLSHAYELRRDAPASPAPNLNPRRPFDDADTLRSEITTAAAATGASGATRVHFSNLADGPERFVVDAIPEGASDASDASAFEAFDASAYDASDASLHADPANGRGRGETRGRARRESRSISEDVEDTSRILDAESRADLKDAATRNLRRRIEDEVREAEDEVREAEDEVREAPRRALARGRGKGKRETEKRSRRRKSTRVAAGAEEDGDARRADSGADSGADSVPPSNRARGTRGNRRTS